MAGMLANSYNPSTQKMEQEAQKLQASRGCGASKGRREMRESREEREKGGRREGEVESGRWSLDVVSMILKISKHGASGS